MSRFPLYDKRETSHWPFLFMVGALISVLSKTVTLTKAEGSKIFANGFARFCFEAVIFGTLLRSLDLARDDNLYPDVIGIMEQKQAIAASCNGS